MKKRMVFLAALALCAGLLCGCGDSSPASRTGSTPAETSLPESQASLAGNQDGEESGPVESPPYLRVSSGDSGVQATRSTFGWTVLIDDRTTKGINADGTGPAAMGEQLPWLEGAGTAELSWDGPAPDSVSVEGVPVSQLADDTAGQPVKCDGDSFPLQEGEWVYTVYATWDSSEDWGGYAWYYVGITG